MFDLLQYIIQPSVISILLPLAIKGIRSLIADIRFSRRKSSQQLLVGIPLALRSDLIAKYPTVTRMGDAVNLNSNIVFLRYNNIASALRRCDYVVVDQVQYTDPRIIDLSMLQNLIEAYSKVNQFNNTLDDNHLSDQSISESATDSYDYLVNNTDNKGIS